MSYPHLEFTQIKRAAEVDGTGDVIWDPADNTHFVIKEVTFTPDANMTFTLFSETDATDEPTINKRVFKGEILADTPVTLRFKNGWASDEQNDRLRGTVSTGTCYVQVLGYEN